MGEGVIGGGGGTVPGLTGDERGGATGGAGGDVFVWMGTSGFVAGPAPLLLLAGFWLEGGGGGRVDGRGISGRGTAGGICGVKAWGVTTFPLWTTFPNGGVTVCFAGLSGAGGGVEPFRAASGVNGRCESLTA